MINSKKLLLLILDGFGIGEQTKYNAIHQAHTPNLDWLYQNYPNSRLRADGQAVGLPVGQVGNSEVGHMTIGAGRRVLQLLPKINKAFAEHTIADLPAIHLINKALNENPTSRLHLIGLCSDGGVHGHINHILGLTDIFSEFKDRVFLHAITDGRDVAPKSAQIYLQQLINNNVSISSVAGRFYAMDRDNRIERTHQYLDALKGNAPIKFSNAISCIESSYHEEVFDEFIEPAISNDFQGIGKQDIILITNYRSDRARQIAASLVEEFTNIYSIVLYAKEFLGKITPLFEIEVPVNTIGEVISNSRLSQLRIAETEKYAHVTYFLNCGREMPFPGEDRLLIPSPKTRTYDLAPEMSVYQLADKLQNAMLENRYSFICANLANCDMVGHSGNISATIKAVEAIDKVLGKLIETAKENSYEMLITADHGNAESMYDSINNQPLTAHTLNPVPLIYFGDRKLKLIDGELSNIAPTALSLLNLNKPIEMLSKSLIDED